MRRGTTIMLAALLTVIVLAAVVQFVVLSN